MLGLFLKIFTFRLNIAKLPSKIIQKKRARKKGKIKRFLLKDVPFIPVPKVQPFVGSVGGGANSVMIRTLN